MKNRVERIVDHIETLIDNHWRRKVFCNKKNRELESILHEKIESVLRDLSFEIRLGDLKEEEDKKGRN